MLTIEMFGERLADMLQVDLVADITPYDGLFDDWGLDSLQAFQMLVAVESMAGATVPPAGLPTIFTVGDAYDYYRTLAPS